MVLVGIIYFTSEKTEPRDLNELPMGSQKVNVRAKYRDTQNNTFLIRQNCYHIKHNWILRRTPLIQLCEVGDMLRFKSSKGLKDKYKYLEPPYKDEIKMGL